MENEIASAEKVMNDSQKPFTAIIGGAKVLRQNFNSRKSIDKATDIIIGGGHGIHL
jgi:phosphoglycerate kinase